MVAPKRKESSTGTLTPKKGKSASLPPPECGKWLEEPHVRDAFERLTGNGCEPHDLDLSLRACRLAWEVYLRDRPPNAVIPPFTFDDYFGLDRSSLRTFLKQMRQCAKGVELLSLKLGSGWVQKIFKSELSPEQRDAEREHFARRNVARHAGFEVPNIPHALRILADAVENETKQANFQTRPIYDAALEGLLRYVRETTRHWYYEQVATLLRAAVTLRDTPDGTALRVWAHSRPALRPLFPKRKSI